VGGAWNGAAAKKEPRAGKQKGVVGQEGNIGTDAHSTDNHQRRNAVMRKGPRGPPGWSGS